MTGDGSAGDATVAEVTTSPSPRADVDTRWVERHALLAGGRRLGYTEYGADDGHCVLFFHGTPGSRLDARLLHDPACAAGVRLVAVDRPGIGASDLSPGRTYLDWPADVTALLAHLGVEQHSLLGFSSGAPYALVCAVDPAPGLGAVAVVSGNSPVDDPEVRRVLPPDSKVYLLLNERAPWVASAATLAMLAPARIVARRWPRVSGRLYSMLMSPGDRRVISDYSAEYGPETGLAGVVESMRSGMRGVRDDVAIEFADWGFDLADIEIRVEVFHGAEDPLVPLPQAEYVARVVPDARLHVIDDVGHLVLYERAAEIFAALVP